MRVFLRLEKLHAQVWLILDSAMMAGSRLGLTCKDGGFQQLYELIDLDKSVHRHFQVGAVTVSSDSRQLRWRRLTILAGDDTPVHKPVQEDTVRK